MSTSNFIGLLGSRGHIIEPEHKTIATIIREIGDNTGNLLFQYASAQLVQNPLLFIGPGCDVEEDMNRVRTDCAAIVFPAANHIDLRLDLGRTAKWLREMGHPVTILGIGTQAKDCTESSFDAVAEMFGADAGFLQLMSLFREPHFHIGVRGTFTQKLLTHFDVPCRITGCPSFLLNPSSRLGRKIEVRLSHLRHELEKASPALQLAVPAASPWEGESILAIERTLIKLLRQQGGLYIQQSGGEDALELAANRQTSLEQRRNRCAWYESRIHTGMNPSDFDSFITRCMRVFFDVREWQKALSGCGLSIGTRYHGNALAMQCEVPAINVVHDSRTEELCISTSVPYLPLNAVSHLSTLAEFVALIRFNAEQYDRLRQDCATSVLELLGASGINPSQQLLQLANGSSME